MPAFFPLQEQPKHPRGAAQRQLSTNTPQSLAGTKSQRGASVTSLGMGSTLQDSPIPPGEEQPLQGCQSQAVPPQEQRQAGEPRLPHPAGKNIGMN